MLASLLRRTGQLTEAADRLRRLDATDGAEKWHNEIARERQLLEEQFHKPTNQNETNSTQTRNRRIIPTTDSANQAA